MPIDNDSIELLIFRYKEGLLSDAEAAELEAALATHPEWKELADLYDPELTLPAGATMPFPSADMLRDGGPKASPAKDGSGRRPVVISTRLKKQRLPLRIAAVAACLLFFVLSVTRFVNDADRATPQTAQAFHDSDENLIVIPAENLQDMLPHADEPAPRPAIRKGSLSSTPGLLSSGECVKSSGECVETPLMATATKKAASDTIRYPLADPTIREINDPMEQEVLYANIIEWQSGNAQPDVASSRQQHIRRIALRAAALLGNAASNYEENRYEIEDAIEERIQSQPFVNNIIATIE